MGSGESTGSFMRGLCLALCLVVAACADGDTDPSSTTAVVAGATVTTLVSFRWTDVRSCYHGFFAADPEQTSAIFFEYVGANASDDVVEFQSPVTLPSPDWNVEVRIGSRLFGNWCTDVLMTDEEPVIDEIWPVVGGRLDLVGGEAPGCGGGDAFELVATDIVAREGEGNPIPIGDLTLRATSWECIQG
ncbi:MAG: hypothetical protein ACRDVD_02845 [Acidimicrobiia bacterium]